MAFVDPEQAQAMLEHILADAQRGADRPGAAGAAGRAGTAYAELVRWLMAETNSGTSLSDIAEATAHVLALTMANLARSYVARHQQAEFTCTMAFEAANEAVAMLQDQQGAYKAELHPGRPQ